MGNSESASNGLGIEEFEAQRSRPMPPLASSVETASSAKAPTAEELESGSAQIRATIYGHCIGDAIGLLTEFMEKSEAKAAYKGKDLEYKMKVHDPHRKRWAIGDWTDDSDQMVLILLSLVHNGGQVKVNDFAQKMKNWMAHGFAELGDTCGFGIGKLTYTVFQHYKFLRDPHTTAKEVWEVKGRKVASNGGVMRTSVVGTHCWWDVDRVVDTALDFVRCTHYDPRCQASAVAVSVVISLMLQRQQRHLDRKGHYLVDALIKDAFAHAAKCLETDEDREVLWQYMSCTQLKELNLAEPGRIGYTYKTMGSGFWALKKDHFRKALQELVMEGGDADTNAAVAGALLGCKLGLGKLPRSWVTGLKHKDWLDQHIESWFSLQKDLAAQKPVPKDSGENATSETGASVSPKTSDKNPGENVSPQTNENPGENVSPQTDDKNPSENVSPQTDDKNPSENFSPQTDDKNPSENVSPQTNAEEPK
ncbi:hypothetical protein ACOMHN_048418 [Nucella lapillus]